MYVLQIHAACSPRYVVTKNLSAHWYISLPNITINVK